MKSFKCVTPVEVRFRDTDAFGHVNNAVYLSYIEIGRAYYWKQVFGVHNYSKADFTLAHVSIDFRSPVFMGESLVVHTRVSRLGTKSFDCRYEIREANTNKLVAEALSTQVMYDHALGKTKLLPHDMRKKITEFEGSALTALFREGG